MTQGKDQTGSDVSAGGEEPFDRPVRADSAQVQALVVSLDGYEGPLDVLLALARNQKLDICRLSMTALADQYLEFVAIARERSLELAAEYLVMAAWLAYLKSKFLIPAKEDDDEPAADEMALHLAFQLKRLEAMRVAAQKLEALPRLGTAVFTRGAPEGVFVRRRVQWKADLYDLLGAYASRRIAAVDCDYHVEPPAVYPVEQARERFSQMLGTIPEWTRLSAVVPQKKAGAPAESVLASMFNAALEFAKDGRIELRQPAAFDQVYIRARDRTGESCGH